MVVKRKEFSVKKIISIVIFIITIIVLTGCSDADVASLNLSRQANQFQLERRIVFYNGITGEYILTIKGRCSITTDGGRLSVTVKTGPTSYKKHYLGLSDNVTYFSEQLEPSEVDVYRYEVIFKPSIIKPTIKVIK